MKISNLLISAALVMAMAAPVAVSAQVVQPPPGQAPMQQGPYQGPQGPYQGPYQGPMQGPGQGQQANVGVHAYNHWMKLLSGLQLSSQQQQQLQGLLTQFAQAHPAGSPRDPQGARALRNQIYSLLNSQQQAQLQQTMQALRAQHQARRMQMQQQQMQQQQGAPPPRV